MTLITRPTNDLRIRLREAGIGASVQAHLRRLSISRNLVAARFAVQRAHGFDLSKWDYNQYIPFMPATNPPKPIDFGMQRTGYGIIKDEKFDELQPGFQEIDLMMAYHYFKTNHSWKAQADKFLEIIDGLGFKAAWLDYESAYNVLDSTSYQNAYLWIDYIKQHFEGIVGFYTNKNIYETLMNPYGTWHHHEEFWYALYFYYPDPFTMTPPMPRGRTKGFDFWQYGITQAYGNSDKGTDYGVGRDTIDVDVAMMPQHELYVKYGVTVVPDPEYTDKEKLDLLWEEHPEIH